MTITKCLSRTIVALLLILVQSEAATHFVPEEFSTIQTAIDSASSGDSILVGPGTYVENLNFLQRHLFVSSTNGADQTIIESAEDSIPVVLISDARFGTAVLNGFSITGSRRRPGILTYRSHTIISNCDIYGCQADVFGGAIYVENQRSVRIINNSVHHNTAGDAGGGLFISYTLEAEVTGNEIYENDAPSGSAIRTRTSNDAPVTIAYNKVYRNRSTNPGFATGAIALTYSRTLECYRNTVAFNFGGIFCFGDEDSYVHSNIIAFNEVFGFQPTGSTIAEYNCIFGNGDGDSLAHIYGVRDDPLFNDTIADDFSLSSESPCIDAGHPNSQYNDFDGSRADIGAEIYNHVFPIALNLSIAEDRIDRVVSHNPVFVWNYYDTSESTQTGYTIQVGRALNPFEDEIWRLDNATSSDSTARYSGEPLVDGAKYYVRLRLQNVHSGGDWSYRAFQMNLIPGIPVPIAPIDSIGAAVSGIQLRVDTVYSIENDTITYDFELYSDSALSKLVFSQYNSPLNQSGIVNDLVSGEKYWWWSRTYDQREHSDWCSAVSFVTREGSILNVPSEYSTIQEALNVASQGDTILLAAGTYTGPGNRDLLPGGRGVVILGHEGPARTIIDCHGSELEPHRAIHVNLSLDTTLVIEGITIQNGFYEEGGGAIYCSGSPLRISNCVFTNNTARWGGALRLDSSVALIDNSVFSANIAFNDGGAIYGLAEGSRIANCQFSSQSALRGAALHNPVKSAIEDCAFTGNFSWGGAIITNQKRSEVRRCSFVANEPDGSTGVCEGGVLYDNCVFLRNEGTGSAIDLPFDYRQVRIRNSTFVSNNHAITMLASVASIEGCLIVYNRGNAVRCFPWFWDPMDPPEEVDMDLSFSNIYANGSNYEEPCLTPFYDTDGNISANPLFCDTTVVELTLDGASPCVGTSGDGGNIGGLPVGCGVTSVEPGEELLPIHFSLSQNYPNPFNPATQIVFDLPEPSPTKLEVFNVLGQRVLTLVDRVVSAGSHVVSWDGKSANGQPVSSGVYLYRLQAREHVKTKKMLLLK